MNSASLAQNAYAQATRIAPSARDTEYRAFAKVTQRLSSISVADPTAFVGLAEAVHENQRLWINLATDVAHAGNSLPDQLRGQIFYLAEFTRVHSARVMRKEAEPTILVEINTAMMRGLRNETGEPAQ